MLFTTPPSGLLFPIFTISLSAIMYLSILRLNVTLNVFKNRAFWVPGEENY